MHYHWKSFKGNISKFLLFLVLLTSCHHKVQEEKDAISCIRTIDANGISQTLNSQTELSKLQGIDFTKNQPYKKVLRIFQKDTHGNSKCILTTYHPNGSLWQYLEGKNFTASGPYKEYYPTGQIKIEAFVLAGPCDLSPHALKDWQFDGPATVYDEEGNISAKMHYIKGELHGKALYYHNGVLHKSAWYRRGALDGEVNLFYSDETLKSKQTYSKGMLDGPSLGYFPSEEPSFIEHYEEGLLLHGIYYDHAGKVIGQIEGGSGNKAIFKEGILIEKQQYQEGKLQGKIEQFSPMGNLLSIYHVKGGKKDGEETIYYEKPSSKPLPKLSIHWHDGQIQGVMRSWYENGILQSQREMVQNKKSGHSISWYDDGSLLCTEEYEHDLLMKGKYYKKREKEPVSTIENGKGIATLYDSHSGYFLRKIKYVDGKPILK